MTTESTTDNARPRPARKSTQIGPNRTRHHEYSRQRQRRARIRSPAPVRPGQAAGAHPLHRRQPRRRRRTPAGSLRRRLRLHRERRADPARRPVQGQAAVPGRQHQLFPRSGVPGALGGPRQPPGRLRVPEPQAARGGSPALPDHLLPGRRGDRRRRHAQYPPAREFHQGPQAGRRQRRDGLLRPGPGGDPEHRDLRRRSRRLRLHPQPDVQPVLRHPCRFRRGQRPQPADHHAPRGHRAEPPSGPTRKSPKARRSPPSRPTCWTCSRAT